MFLCFTSGCRTKIFVYLSQLQTKRIYYASRAYFCAAVLRAALMRNFDGIISLSSCELRIFAQVLRGSVNIYFGCGSVILNYASVSGRPIKNGSGSGSYLVIFLWPLKEKKFVVKSGKLLKYELFRDKIVRTRVPGLQNYGYVSRSMRPINRGSHVQIRNAGSPTSTLWCKVNQIFAVQLQKRLVSWLLNAIYVFFRAFRFSLWRIRVHIRL